MQNKDGGYPAFDVGKTGDRWLFKLAFAITGISNSAEVFDPSSPDVTGHIFEGFATTAINLEFHKKNDV